MLFKKKKNYPELYNFLDASKEEAQNRGQNYFFYLLKNQDVDIAKQWCQKNRMIMDIDHKTDNNLIYKFREV